MNVRSVFISDKTWGNYLLKTIEIGELDIIEVPLEEGIGSPFDIWVIIEDSKGKRLCRGAVFSYYEFKHLLKDRLTDEK